MELKKLVCSQLGLGEEASDEQINAALIALHDPARSPEAVMALRNELVELKSEIAKRDASGAVEKAFSEGKLIEAQREWAMNYASTSPDGFALWASSAPSQVPMKKIERSPEAAKNADSSVALSDEQRKINQLLGVSDEEFAKYNK